MFEQVVFAGGGHRCWWQAGFYEKLREEVELRPRVIAGVSAGAATACLMFAATSLEALEYYDEQLGARADRPAARNVYWNRLFRKGERVLPHDDIYRQALATLFGTERFAQLQWTAPEIRVVYATLPGKMGPVTGTVLGMLAYNLEKKLYQPLHPTWGRRLGFHERIAKVQDCDSSDALVSLLIASACTPPLTRVERRDGEVTLDGGVIDNVPVQAVESGRSTLVLLSRRYPRHAQTFAREGRIYVQPSQPVPVRSWDYSDPKKFRLTYELGRADARQFLTSFAAIRVAAH